MLKFWAEFLRLAVILIVFSLFAPSALMAQTNQATSSNLGVIDMNVVLQQSDAIAKVREVLDQRNTEFQSSITQEELRLRQEERELNAAQGEIAEDEFAARYAQFEEDVVALQRSIQQQQSRFDLSMQQVNTRLEQELINIVEEIAKDRQLTMVIQRSNVVIYDLSTDITDEALRRLNERTKNLTVTLQRDDN